MNNSPQIINRIDSILDRIDDRLDRIDDRLDRMLANQNRINDRLSKLSIRATTNRLNIHTEVIYVDTLENCPICNESTTEVKTECGHCFCEKCIQKWMTTSTHSSCPYCRNNLTNTLFYRLQHVLQD